MTRTSTDDLDENMVLLETLESANIVREWKRQYNIDVGHLFGNIEYLKLFYFKDLKIKRFVPAITGDSCFYETLSRIPWYYMSDKWEHDIAYQFVESGMRVLEVGCGTGAFLRKLEFRNIKSIGLELNANAVAEAHKIGLDVRGETLSDFLAHYGAERFDLVCSFQVLEHVCEPYDFIRDCVDALKTGGVLILSVPNDQSFVGRVKGNLFNMPPHHVTLWNELSFDALEERFSLHVISKKFEPLQQYHVHWFASTLTKEIYSPAIFRSAIHQTLERAFGFILDRLKLRKVVRGHTLLVAFTKQ